MWLWVSLVTTLSWYNILFLFTFVTYVYDIKKKNSLIYVIYISLEIIFCAQKSHNIISSISKFKFKFNRQNNI